MTSVTGEIVSALRRNRDEFLALADSLGPDDWNRETPDNETWTVKDALSHLTASDRSMAGLVKAVVEGTYDVEAGKRFILSDFNERQVERRRETSVADLRTEMDQNRAQLMSMVAQLTTDQLSTPVWSFGVDGTRGIAIPLGERLLEYASHDAYHAAHVKTAVGR